MALLEMLVRGKTCVGLSEVLRSARPDGVRRKNPRRTVGLAAMAAIVLSFGGLWLSLGTSGPVLGPDAPQAQAAPAAFMQPDEPGAGSAASLSPKGLTLAPDLAKTVCDLPSQDGAGPREAATPGLTEGVSLMPPRDQGPEVREAVEPLRPPALQVEQPEAEPMPAALALATRPMPRQAALGSKRP